MARTYEVKGTREYLYWGIGLLMFSMWCVRDGWFTTQSKIDEKYREAAIEAEQQVPPVAEERQEERQVQVEVLTETLAHREIRKFVVFNQITGVVTALIGMVCLVVHKVVK